MNNRKPWAILVYISADNNLYKHAQKSLRQMLQARIDGEAHIVAQLDGRRVKTKRYDLSGPGELEEHIVDSFDNIDGGSYLELEAFLRWAIERYDAAQYAIVLWGHGTGRDEELFWNGPDMLGKKPSRRAGPNHLPQSARQQQTMMPEGGAAGIGHQSGASGWSFISNHELRGVLTRIQEFSHDRIALLGTDACFMSMVELGFEFRCVPLMVASETGIPWRSWPYTAILRRLKEHPQFHPEEFARVIVEEFANFYDGKRSTTLSSCDANRIPDVVKATDKLAAELISATARSPVPSEIALARAAATDFCGRNYVDLFDFCRHLEQSALTTSLRAACTDVMSAINETVLANRTTGKSLAGANGLAIYFPRMLPPNGQKISKKMSARKNGQILRLEHAIRKDNLEFSQETRWDTFLLHALKAARVSNANSVH
ncbi:MAG: clostripain-related cysteine peptidase [Acidobacteriales bacterium]|nr:clostripain-related cysteine peptidase [Terriglobales bacterium]